MLNCLGFVGLTAVIKRIRDPRFQPTESNRIKLNDRLIKRNYRLKFSTVMLEKISFDHFKEFGTPFY